MQHINTVLKIIIYLSFGVRRVVFAQNGHCTKTEIVSKQVWEQVIRVPGPGPLMVSKLVFEEKEMKICCSGYSGDGIKCVPICDTPCQNSICAAPNKCTCNPGYTQINNFSCVPYCSSCQFGNCVGPEFCDCLPGYEKDATGVCSPQCPEEGCQLKKDQNGIYQLRCGDNICVNSYCAGPDLCVCFEGFIAIPEDPYKCIPVSNISETLKLFGTSTITESPEHNEVETKSLQCIPNCMYGSCIEGQCQCDKGHVLSENLDNWCIPECEYHCKGGFCGTNNICQCYIGYEIINGNECVQKCLNGLFLGNDSCKCWDGYILTMDNGRQLCNPVCNDGDGCFNGNCIAPDICECPTGFYLNIDDPFVCLPAMQSLFDRFVDKIALVIAQSLENFTKSISEFYILIVILAILFLATILTAIIIIKTKNLCRNDTTGVKKIVNRKEIDRIRNGSSFNQCTSV